MGYTHYWEQKSSFDPYTWEGIRNDFAKAVKSTGVKIADWTGTKGSFALVSDNEITFNGVEPDDHETFRLQRAPESNTGFCKTARKPYDLLVCLTLLIAYDRAPDCIEITSDGSYDDWEKSVVMFLRLYGKLPKLPHLLRPKV